MKRPASKSKILLRSQLLSSSANTIDDSDKMSLDKTNTLSGIESHRIQQKSDLKVKNER